MNSKGLLVVVSGPSGVGKGTVCAEYVKKHDDCALSVSATTRAAREGERDGVNYYFIGEDEFVKKINEGGFLENAVFCGNRYGTPKAPVQGAMQVRSSYPEGVFVFVLPPDMKTLEQRLRGRNTESDEVIEKRLSRAKEEFNFIEKYNYVLVNDAVENAVRKLGEIIKAEKCVMARNYEYIKKEFLS